MNILLRRCGYVAVASLFLLAPAAFATTADMALTSAGSNVLGGVYVGPYTATINGVSTQVICDDWADESVVGQKWTAYVNTLSPLSNGATQTKWGNNQLLYDQVAWLVTQILAPPSACPAGGSCDIVGDISFALWQLTDPSANPFANLSGSDLKNAQWWLTQAQSLTLAQVGSGQFAGFMIYMPVVNGQTQEFIVRAPESSAALLLGVDLLGLFGLVVVFRRRLARHSH